MIINHEELLHRTPKKAPPIQDRHSVNDRIRPSIFQYDYLGLKFLYQDIECLLTLINKPNNKEWLAVDIGSDKSPYFQLLSQFGFLTKTLDLNIDFGADFAGTAEETNLADKSVDLIICTQVLEHTRSPWKAMREFARILKPEGYVLFSIPHAWFYHPHPSDFWRMTQEGVVALCEDEKFDIIELRSQGGSIAGLCQVVNFVLYGGIKEFGAPIYALINMAALVLDKAIPNPLFSLNFACLARTNVTK